MRSVGPSLAAVACVALLGCGYTLVSYPKDRAHVEGVAVQTLVNDSYEPGYEFIVVDALREEFARRGALRLVDDPRNANIVVRGRIAPINTARRSFSSVVLTLEYVVRVALQLEVTRNGEEVGLDRLALHEQDFFLASADAEATRKNREEALRRIAAILAARLHDLLYEVAPAHAPAEEGTPPVLPPDAEPVPAEPLVAPPPT